MKVTIGIATWNRAGVLSRTLANLARMRVPAGLDYQVIVVDNNSTDDTSEVIQSYAGVLPLAGLFEGRQGKSWALNRAINEARGDYVVWIDDDILVEESWLCTYYRAFRRHPEAGLFGGSITPRVETDVPYWYPDALELMGGIFGKCDVPTGRISEHSPFMPAGGNMALRMDVQKACLYDTHLGRRGGALLAGEESEVCRRALALGVPGYWVPEARVEHLVPTHYLSLNHVRRYWRGRGGSAVLANHDIGDRTLLGRPRWAWRQALQSELEYWFDRMLFRSPNIWLPHLRDASYALGVLAASRGSLSPNQRVC